MGGPFADHSGSLILLEKVREYEARELVARDLFVVNGVFVFADVRAWNVYVDELTKHLVPGELPAPRAIISERAA